MKKIAVILSGCGFKDGSEITEAISSLICLSQEGVEYQCFAPDMDFTSTNHASGEAADTRNLLVESSRISRGDITNLNELDEKQFDGLLFPGGFGAALHLCDWAQKGSNCSVLPKIESTIKDFHGASKPIGAICISPVLLAKVLGPNGVTLTIGTDKETAQEINKTGAEHEDCSVNEYISDRENKVLSTPAYMFDAKPNQVFSGISKMFRELVEMA